MNVWMIGKIYWNIITLKRRVLQSLKYGRCYWYRLCECKKSFWGLWNKIFKIMLWFVCSKRYIIVSWCIWELSKDVSWSIWTWSHPFSYCTGLVWQASLKKTKVKLDLLTDIDMSLMMEKDIRGRICHSIYWYIKGKNKCMKDYDKSEKSSILRYKKFIWLDNVRKASMK